ncbi:BgTH12-05820 [Blumeria graminis f. sp. triticale]|uniref:Bgt-1542 n=3 Tax=Blumeria graminis TaxID=34373 RepID=A0A9X9MK58_BLUGR|nr:hypothetical protein BGT96224_1542 [Blumeria graminis f. sp. tritici 96224]CAD6504083.1 BgTH12-05820 [Blumeria graminis f. sp. triticale]VDB90818.1 Bgt-1542 [Blumeria graminis f. sp. tritici]
MVALPLFKFAALFLKHVSKYGANWIKSQAHDHPKFRIYAARYGQSMHQINMRMAVTLLQNSTAEKQARERKENISMKAEKKSPIDDAIKEKTSIKEKTLSTWKRRFRPLPEGRAVDLFADVIGDAFILMVAGGLILYEYVRTKGRPDLNAEKIAELQLKLEDLDRREIELEQAEKIAQGRVDALELTLTRLENKGYKV